MYVNVTGGAFPGGDLSKLSDGPSREERDSQRARAVVEVTGINGSVSRSVIETVNGYLYTPLAAVEAARRVLACEKRLGFDTPTMLFGASFAESIAGTRVMDQLV